MHQRGVLLWAWERIYSLDVALESIIEVLSVRDQIDLEVTTVAGIWEHSLQFFINKLVGPFLLSLRLADIWNLTEFSGCILNISVSYVNQKLGQ
jgi:hypothetical protein